MTRLNSLHSRPSRPSRRGGYTLIELLVVIGIISALSAMAMRVVPSILDKDRSTDAVNILTGGLQRAKAQAARDKLPRGLRLIVGANQQATGFQLIEAPPVFVPNPNGPDTSTNPLTNARVLLSYTPTTGATTARQCVIQNLTSDQAAQIIRGVTIQLPTLGTWHTVIGDGSNNPNNDPSAVAQSAPLDTTKFSVGVMLGVYPDVRMGATTNYVTYNFGIYGLARPLLGEPTVQLPSNTCVDLAISQPTGLAASNYDILFGPSGPLVASGLTTGSASSAGSGQVFLWVRDPTKPTTMSNPPSQAQVQAGGEQMVVVIKTRTGAIGAAPIYWPDNGASYAPGSTPFTLAQKAVSSQ